MSRFTRRHPQRGSTLVVSLIMLTLLTILALSALNIGRGSLQVSANAQARALTHAAAQQVINQVISNRTFTETPGNVLDNSNCAPAMSAPPNSRCVDVDSRTQVLVSLQPAPRCVQMRPILTSELNLSDSEDLGCAQGLGQNSGVIGSGAVNSLCSNTLWEITAVASDPVTGARSTLVQGVAVRVSSDSAASFCP